MSIGADPKPTPALFASGGEMGELMATYDWSATPLGLTETWPQSLKTAIRIMLTSRYAMFVWWGDELVNLYNDAYRPFLGVKHPASLGKSARDVWAEIWELIGPRTDAVLLRGESTFDEALLLIMDRHGYPEETYFTFSYSPVPDDDGEIGGIFCAVTEETDRVIGERRLRLLRELAAQTAMARSIEDVCGAWTACIALDPQDFPFAGLYLSESDGHVFRLSCVTGIDPGHVACPPTITLSTDAEVNGAPWRFQDVVASTAAVVIENLAGRFSEGLPTGVWSSPPVQGITLPIRQPGDAGLAAVLTAGLNPHRRLDEEFRGFLDVLSGQVAAALANVQAHEAERRRAEALMELDRAKTTFFSNVSHELRTPLTLLLGPLADLLEARGNAMPSRAHEQLLLAQRNGMRLLRLVNTLLEFSRIEAGRVQASYEPTDLALFTADLASGFRSAIERGGLTLTVDCPPLPEPVFVDREMWEKIVLNLLSNALKFTFVGEIRVTLRQADGQVVLDVADSGTGIPASELPHLFERFHRVQAARARTQEGTGIGLALVQELVKLHAGSIDVASLEGDGTTFTVTLPLGSAHIPADRIATGRSRLANPLSATPFLQDALSWVPSTDLPGSGGWSDLDHQGVSLAATDPSRTYRILLADDNADMREYIRRLLASHWQVETAADGQSALVAARERPPDLIVADVMMPGLDGFALLREMRASGATSTIPIILLSARAGEEARIEGLAAGADDYLVKPFSARELIARIEAHLKLAESRAEISRQEQSARKTLEEALLSREQFLSIASHELRNPIAGISVAAQLLQRDHRLGRLDDERLTRLLRTIESGCSHLAVLTNDLLDVSQLQLGQLPLHLQTVDLAELVRDVAARQILSEEHRLVMKLPSSPCPVTVDPIRIEQIVANLLDNAHKYSPEGGEIQITLTSDEAGILLAVADHGLGLPADSAEQIFEPMVRGANTSDIAGLGLGLYIARGIATRHGGRLWAESAGDGMGTTMYLSLPVIPADRDEGPRP